MADMSREADLSREHGVRSAAAFSQQMERELELAHARAQQAMEEFFTREAGLDTRQQLISSTAWANAQLVLEEQHRIMAEAQLQVVESKAIAKPTLARAELLLAEQRIAEQDHELRVALKLQGFESMSDELCAIAVAQNAGKLSTCRIGRNPFACYTPTSD